MLVNRMCANMQLTRQLWSFRKVASLLVFDFGVMNHTSDGYFKP